MERWIGIDYGTRRIGVAIADPGGTIASPAAVLRASGSVPGDARLVMQWASSMDAGGFVVGLPLNMDGSESAQTKLSQAFANALGKRTELEVVLWDERLTSFAADQVLDVANVGRSRRKTLRDAIAAQVMLQSFLDARGAEPSAAR